MMRKYIKWLQYSSIAILLTILSISFFNYKVDSLGLFGNSNYLLQAAKTLTSGKMIAGLKNYDERLFQELIIKNLKVKNNVIAIGSSRTMQLRKRFFLENKTNYFNHSVSGAGLEDYIAILGAYELIHKYLPSTVILGIDPWIFNKNSGQNRWKSLSKYYNYEIDKIYNKTQDSIANVNTNKWKSLSKYYNYEIDKIYNKTQDFIANVNTNKWKQLLNYDYTISNINFFKALQKNNDKAFYITDIVDIDDSIKEIDGSIHYPFKTRYIKENLVKASAISYAKKPVYSLEKFKELNNLKLFEDFIKYLQSKHVNIIFFLPPYNPVTYDLLVKQQEYQVIDKVEKYLILFSSKKNIVIKGSYNPQKYNFKVKDFFDGMHNHDYAVEKMW